MAKNSPDRKTVEDLEWLASNALKKDPRFARQVAVRLGAKDPDSLAKHLGDPKMWSTIGTVFGEEAQAAVDGCEGNWYDDMKVVACHVLARHNMGRGE